MSLSSIILSKAGLRPKFIIAISLLLTFTLGSTAYYLTRHQEQQLFTHLEARVTSLGSFVALISPESIYAFDITTLDRFVSRVSADPDVTFALIRNHQRLPMTTSLPEGITQELVNEFLSGKTIEENIRILRFPIHDKEAQLGEVIIALDETGIRNQIRDNLIRHLLTYLLIILFLASFIFVIFHFNVLRQVGFLISGANRVSEGNYDFQLPVISGDELSTLIRCFNRMTLEIREDQEELKTTNSQLSGEIEQRRLAEEKMRLAASVFTYAREGITITDPDGEIIEVNDAFTKITGYSREEAVGQNPRILKSGRHDPQFYQSMWNNLLTHGYWAGEIWNQHKDGHPIAELLTISAVMDETGRLQHYVALFSDITEQKEYERQLEHIAHFDALTGLPNRVLLGDRLDQAIVQTTRRSNYLAVIYLDLDGFKEVNDTYGHNIGDKLLLSIANRMRYALRASDTIGRLGGDEFVAVLMDLENKDESVPLLERLLQAASDATVIDGLNLKVSASIGVTFYPQIDDVDADQLLRQADQAMYQAKLDGRNRYSTFNPEKELSLRGRNESLERISSALAHDEFELFYQPKVNLRSGEVFGAEALIRWHHPEQGLLYPRAFLPILEAHPLAIELGEWVINSALRQLQQWQQAGLDLSVSVNLDAYHLQQRDFMSRLRQILARHPETDATHLQLEILETSTLSDMRHVAQVMQECLELGIEFALDDFGTGYSSLIYLKNLPARHIKIDQTFVRDMLDDSEDLAIVEGVLGLATAFQRQVIAEGIESEEHGAILLQLGCEQGQGYGIARPMPADAFNTWCTQWSSFPSWERQKRIKKEDLSALFAIVDHRAWMQAVERCILGERVAPPQMNIHDCRFGQWLDQQQGGKFRQSAVFDELSELHEEIHELARELLVLHAQGKSAESIGRLPRLKQLRDSILVRMRELLA